MLRLIFSLIVFAASLLMLFRAPANIFWIFTVAITSYLVIAQLLVLGLFVSCFWAPRFRAASLLFSGAALAVLFVPVLRHYARAELLKIEFPKAFPDSDAPGQLPQPYSYWKSITGLKYKGQQPYSFVYKQAGNRDLVIDFYKANTRELAPCVIMVHGGSWQSRDQRDLPELNEYLADKGYHVAALSYRLAPKYKCPAPSEDVNDAINMLILRARELRIDTNNFALIGRSAGAQIAMLNAYRFPRSCIRGAVSFYGPLDMVWGAQIGGNPLIMNTDKVLSDYVGGNYRDVPELYAESSPYEYAGPASVPTLLIHGETDALVSFHHSEHMKRKLDTLGVKNYFLDLPNATHACDYRLSSADGQMTAYAIERFLYFVFSL